MKQDLRMNLRRFMFLAYALHLMDADIDVDEAGLTIEQFEKMDELLGEYLAPQDVEEMEEELIEIVKELTKDE
ncbi:hypothetical protein [Paenibacillus sp. OV219]|uniref:hypothetical protein n=1 Tax=Paenibacillus sp. OV219 TaxID=1884377 RepID=UPI0008CBD645|nr:hypothetical protein [Paenibacillus sp. OV219]SEN20004.1 hypothetical protein SAMN05518847_102398 [Paenibacillus sp. OV219]